MLESYQILESYQMALVIASIDQFDLVLLIEVLNVYVCFSVGLPCLMVVGCDSDRSNVRRLRTVCCCLAVAWARAWGLEAAT